MSWGPTETDRTRGHPKTQMGTPTNANGDVHFLQKCTSPFAFFRIPLPKCPPCSGEIFPFGQVFFLYLAPQCCFMRRRLYKLRIVACLLGDRLESRHKLVDIIFGIGFYRFRSEWLRNDPRMMACKIVLKSVIYDPPTDIVGGNACFRSAPSSSALPAPDGIFLLPSA